LGWIFVVGFGFGGGFGGLREADSGGASVSSGSYLLKEWFGVFVLLAEFEEVEFGGFAGPVFWD